MAVFKDSFVSDGTVSCDDMEYIVQNWLTIKYYAEIIDTIVDEDMKELDNVSEIYGANISGA